MTTTQPEVYENLGVRICDDEYQIGDRLPESSVWDDGEPTDDLLPGTCAITVRWGFDNVRSVDEALLLAGGYVGKHAYLIGSNAGAERGVDDDEIIIRDAVVLGVIL